jgi:hypothetical protein
MHSSNPGHHWRFAALSVALLPVALWLLMHGYHGLTEDGQIYAFQALARLHPSLSTDLYLQNISQDQFTIFSPVYAWGIQLLGLENSARLITLVFTVCFFAAAWNLVRSVTDRESAWLAVALLLIISGDYGGSGVFRILDPYLTARLPAEALTITALACYFRGMRRLGFLLALVSMFIHPLIALPGVLLVACLMLPIRVGTIAAIAGVFAALALAAVNLPTAPHALTVMDAPWLDVVRERSQFLFLQLWSFRDWQINAQPFISLAVTAIVVPDEQIRKLCVATALVGAAGLAVACIGSFIGPVSILVQGQGWRWVWIGVFFGAALVPCTALHMWRDKRSGPLCALLLVLGWTLPGVDGTVFVSLALALWSIHGHIRPRLVTQIRWLPPLLCAAIVVWLLTRWWDISSTVNPPLGHAHEGAAQIQNLFSLRIPAVLLSLLVWWGVRKSRPPWVPAFVAAMLVALSARIAPAALDQSSFLAANADIREFADWANAIPPTSTVLVAPPRDVGAFVWFTLGRPNYLALDQSSGVVFSRVTALEVQRRSEVLLPLMDPDWKVLTKLRARSGSQRKKEPTTRALTAKSLIQVCTDPRLGFVISPEKVGFDPVRHEHAGAWKDWNLYDCRKVRSAASAT